ncbi:MAG: preprotein translocase subunit SecG [Vicinamibacterales bacterium]|jgi:preprotein translocase subunit SecG|nr:preprotein translocase subunit SecG [Vicinamibacterales bacterium]
MFYYLLVAVYVLVCFFLLLSILLQQGRAGDIASAFGGSSSQTVFGARTGATMLTRATTILAALFMIGSIGLAIAWQKGPTSVVSGVNAPAAPTAPATPPATPPAAPVKK